MKSRENTAPLLSERLRMLAAMVTPGNRLADVGCDHGFLDIYLLRKGICPEALAMDVRQGPLAGAEEHIREYGLGDYIKVRLSDGLEKCAAGEAETLVCAGMGGRLMERILREGADRAREMKELILQPQSEIPEFRIFLRNAGFRIIDEDAVFEEGKYYFAMKAVYRGDTPGEWKQSSVSEDDNGSKDTIFPEYCSMLAEDGALQVQKLYDLFGEHLLLRKHPVLLKYLEQRGAYIRKLEASMAAAGTEKARRRLEEIHREQKEIEQALLFF